MLGDLVMKSDAEALVKLSALIDAGKTIHLYMLGSQYEVTVFEKNREHHHYQGKSLVEAINKVKNV